MKKRVLSTVLVLAMVLSLFAGLSITASAASATYVKVTAEPTDWSGTYVLVYEHTETEAYLWTGVDAGKCYQVAGISNGTIIADASATITVAAMEGGYSIQINGGTNDTKYIGKTGYTNGMDFTTAAALNTIALGTDGVTITAVGGCTMRFNSSNGDTNLRFRYYKSGQKPVQLYKLTAGDCEHVWGEWSETTAPTCTEPGLKVRTCTLCSATESGTVEALGHDWVAGTVTAPTCVLPGSTHYACSRCDAEKDDDVTDALGHEYENGACIRCGAAEASFTVAASIAANDTVVLAVRDATKEFNGISVGTSTLYGLGIDFTGTVAGVMPLTVVAGASEGTWAFRLPDNTYLYWNSGNSLATTDEIVEKSSWTVTFDADGNAAILNADDSTRQIWWNVSSPRFACYTDKVAGSSYYTTQLFKFSAAHTCAGNLVAHAAAEPTCTEPGNDAYWQCSVCDKYYSDANAEHELAARPEIAALGHDYGEFTSNNNGTHTKVCSRCSDPVTEDCTFEATVTGTVKTYTCTVCSYSYDEQLATYTVTYSDCGVTTTEDVLQGASVTLPAAGTAVEGWTFAGWVAAAIDPETATRPAVLTGEYTPEASVTLYAVYTRTEAGTGTGTPAAPFAVGDTGSYVIAAFANETWYALPVAPTLNSGKIAGTAITVSNNEGVNYVTAANAEGYVWTLAAAGDYYTLFDGEKFLHHANGGASDTNLNYSNSETFRLWRIANVSDEIRFYGAIAGEADKDRGILFRYNQETPVFGGYALSNSGTSGYANITLLPVEGGSGNVTYYTTNPGTVEVCEHTYEKDNEASVAASCTEPGKDVYVCTKCGDSYEETVAALGHLHEEIPAVMPTCTEAGATAGDICPRCNTVLTAPTEIPALGHDYIYTDNHDGETHTVTCGRCDYSEVENHAFTEGVCVCGAVESTEPEPLTLNINHTIDLAEDISIMFAVQKTLVADYDADEMYLTFSYNHYNGNEVGEAVTGTLLPDGEINRNYWYFTLSGITAVEMGNDVTAQLHLFKDGTEYVVNDSYSVATYAYNQLNKTNIDDASKTVCANLLRYGAAAQNFKATRTDALPDAAMTDVQKAYLTDPDTVTFTNNYAALDDLAGASVTWVGKTFQMNTRVELMFVFNLENFTGNREDLHLIVNYTDYTGTAKTYDVPNGRMLRYNPNDDTWYFCADCMRSADMRTVLSVAVYEGETRVSPTMQYSVESYACNKTGEILNLCKCLLAYSDACAAKFAR